MIPWLLINGPMHGVVLLYPSEAATLSIRRTEYLDINGFTDRPILAHNDFEYEAMDHRFEGRTYRIGFMDDGGDDPFIIETMIRDTGALPYL